MYFAGCYRQERNSPFTHFVILTRQAVNVLEIIHGRIPVFVPKVHAKSWLYESLAVIEFAVLDLMCEVV